MRIIGGEYSGRRINAPKGDVSRPTTDRTRESLFNVLTHRDDLEFDGARVIDLFAGSGALGLEALSRGAAHCLFVEQDASARAAIRDNIESLSLFGQTRIHRRSATSLGKMPASTGGAFSVAFLDPPYRKNLVLPALKSLHEGGWLEQKSFIIIEQAKDDPAIENTFFQPIDTRRYADTQISFYRYQAT